MKITLNNRAEEFESESLSIAEILIEKNFIFKMLVIKLNNKFVEKTDYSETFVTENDDLQIIHLISGG